MTVCGQRPYAAGNVKDRPRRSPPEDYFGYEILGIGFDPSPMFEVKTLYKDDHVIVQRTPYGGVRKNFRTYASTPEIID